MNSRIEVKFTGTLAKAPVLATSRNGTPWTRLYCNVPVYGDHSSSPLPTWVTISIRGDEGRKHMHLQQGDEIAVNGELRLNSYEKQGRPMIGMTINPTSIVLIARAAT